MKKVGLLMTFGGFCLCLSGFLMSYENIGFTGLTVYFHLPALIFTGGLFIASCIINLISND